MAAQAILIAGSPRSGTTWLAKIFDSHPDVLYRHEPDEVSGADPALDPCGQLAEWLRQRCLRVAAKQPRFAKSWRSAGGSAGRGAMAMALAAAQRLSPDSSAALHAPLPDFVRPSRWQRVRAAIKLVNWDASAALRAAPALRCAFILRHPGGQIASVLAGQDARHLASTVLPDEMASACRHAARSGVDPQAFAALSKPAQYAWLWRSFNEPVVDQLRSCPNARILTYEELCRAPEATARELFAFAGLPWHEQTAAFLNQSTRRDHGSQYFDVYRMTDVVAERWRTTLDSDARTAIHAVVGASPLAPLWPDFR